MTDTQTITTNVVLVKETETGRVRINESAPLPSQLAPSPPQLASSCFNTWTDFDALMKEREQDDIVFGLGASLEHGFDSADNVLDKYKKIIGQPEEDLTGSNLKNHMLKRMYDGPMDCQGKFMKCPLDYHKGPFMFSEDKFEYIFNGETDQNIEQNFNSKLGQSINGTSVTQGMMNYAKGNKWSNGMIAYNKNCIIVRDADNGYGQPGFLSMVCFYNRIAVDIMKKYIVPQLIHNVNEKTINTKCDPQTIQKLICDTYSQTYKEKLILLDNNDMTTEVLFEDALPQEKLNVLLDEKDKKIDMLEKKISAMSSRLNQLLKKFVELEDMVLDINIAQKKTNLTTVFENC